MYDNISVILRHPVMLAGLKTTSMSKWKVPGSQPEKKETIKPLPFLQRWLKICSCFVFSVQRTVPVLALPCCYGSDKLAACLHQFPKGCLWVFFISCLMVKAKWDAPAPSFTCGNGRRRNFVVPSLVGIAIPLGNVPASAPWALRSRHWLRLR